MHFIMLLTFLTFTITFARMTQYQRPILDAPFTNFADVPCGLTPSRRLGFGRIIGGRDASHGEFPWTVSFQSVDGAHFCGGVILDRYHILTAGHCFIFHLYGIDTALKDTLIVAGATDMIRGSANGQRLVVEKLSVHPNFSHFYPDFHNDIAVVRVQGGLEWGPHVQPACLSSGQSQTKEGSSWGFVAGWGVQSKEDSEGGVLRDGRLKKVALPLWKNGDCQKAYTTAGVDWVTKPSHLCAGTRDGSRDSCRGDSGSALFTRNNGRMVASGLVSGGEGCSTPGIPGIYTRISHFLPWIRDNVLDKSNFNRNKKNDAS